MFPDQKVQCEQFRLFTLVCNSTECNHKREHERVMVMRHCVKNHLMTLCFSSRTESVTGSFPKLCKDVNTSSILVNFVYPPSFWPAWTPVESTNLLPLLRTAIC